MNEVVVVVDDEEDILKLVSIHLEKEKFRTFKFLSAFPFKEWLSERRVMPNLIILDLMLPDQSGLDLCKELKSDERYSDIPVIILTARSGETDKVVGLELGADDYVTKPFSPRELIARVKAVLRRTDRHRKQEERHRSICGIDINFSTHEVFVDAQKIELTATEFKILEILSSRIGWVFSREKLLERLWGHEKYPTERSIDVHINNLRKKLGKAKDRIKNLRGVGYKME